MSLLEILENKKSVYLDSAPVIYYIESHSEYGPIMQQVINLLNSRQIKIITSVVTLTEVLPQPLSQKRNDIVEHFLKFLKSSSKIELIDINETIAEQAGRLKGKYFSLKTADSLQLAAAIYAKADLFFTNDIRLNKINDIKIFILKDLI